MLIYSHCVTTRTFVSTAAARLWPISCGFICDCIWREVAAKFRGTLEFSLSSGSIDEAMRKTRQVRAGRLYL